MNDKIKLKGPLKVYMRWPILLIALLALMNIAVYVVDLRAGAVTTAFVAIYVLMAVMLYFHKRPVILNELISFATQYGQVQKKLIQTLALPYALLDADGKLVWMNDEFMFLVEKDKNYRRFIGNIFPEITHEKLPLHGEVREFEMHYHEHDYRLSMKRVEIDELLDASTIVDVENDRSYLIALYLFDETELKRYIKKNEEEKLVTGDRKSVV